MKYIIAISFTFLATLANAIVVNAQTQSLYLGNNNVNCGRYILTNNSRLSDVQSFCRIIGSTYANDGQYWLRVQTTQFGSVDCSFVSGQLNQCFKD